MALVMNSASRPAVDEAERVVLSEYVEAVTVGHSETASAHRPDGTGTAGIAPSPVTPRYFRIIDFRKVALEDVADLGRELTTRVNLTVRKEGNEIEGCTAAMAGTATERFKSILVPEDINEIVFESHNRVPFCRLAISFEK